MHAFRSRVGVVSVATGTAILLALPVVATGQVPGVDQVVGGVTETAQSIAPAAPALPAPPAQVQVPAPKPPAAAPRARPRGTRACSPGTGRVRACGSAPERTRGRAAVAVELRQGLRAQRVQDRVGRQGPGWGEREQRG